MPMNEAKRERENSKVLRPAIKVSEYNLDVAEPPPEKWYHIPGHQRAAFKMYLALSCWVSFYVGISCWVAIRLPCWAHSINC